MRNKNKKQRITEKFAMKKYEQYLYKIENKLGDGETSSHQLNELGRKLFGKQFVGSFGADRIPTLLAGQYCIINLDDHDEPGSHWVAIIKHKKKEILIYDSFGRKTQKILPDLFDRKAHPRDFIITEAENDSEQKIQEENCGQRSLSALMVYHIYGKPALIKI